MIVKNFILVNPFIEAYIHSDLLGKLIFVSLVLLSVLTWIILLYKGWTTSKMRKNSYKFNDAFQSKRVNPLAVEVEESSPLNPFFELYSVLKRYTVEILNKNRAFAKTETAYLSPSDIEILQSHLSSTIAKQTNQMEAYLFILAMIMSLGPFLGLLGTAWGILITFPELKSSLGSNQMMFTGLSLALATTVLGLIDAIPALIGYHYFKNSIRDFETEMEGFSTEILSSVEMQYRKVNVN